MAIIAQSTIAQTIKDKQDNIRKDVEKAIKGK